MSTPLERTSFADAARACCLLCVVQPPAPPGIRVRFETARRPSDGDPAFRGPEWSSSGSQWIGPVADAVYRIDLPALLDLVRWRVEGQTTADMSFSFELMAWR
jgi:hypothetical protein